MYRRRYSIAVWTGVFGIGERLRNYGMAQGPSPTTSFHMNSEVSDFARISIAFAIGSTIALLVQSHDHNAYATRGRKV